VATVNLSSARLVLRTLDAADARGPYLRWINDREVTKYLESRFREFSEADLRTYIEFFNLKDNALLLGIFECEAVSHIGNIKLEIEPYHRRGEIGVVIGNKMQWGRGYASEAIDCLAEYAFGQRNLHKLTAGCYSENRGSQRAFEKAGFTIEGHRKEHYLFEKKWVDLVMLARMAPLTGFQS
jgi:ribosomal-protein-alanine N-acetyltransferase